MIISNRSDCQRVSAYRIFLYCHRNHEQWMAVLLGKHTPMSVFDIRIVVATYANLTFPRDHFHSFRAKPTPVKTGNKEPRNMLIQLSAGHFQKAVFILSYIYPTKPCSRRIHIRIADQPISCRKATRDSSSLCSSFSSAA